MKVETEYKCGCVYSNNRWFPECPRHAEWWQAQAGTGDSAFVEKKHKTKRVKLLYTNDTLKAIHEKIHDDSIGMILTYPMFQYDDLDFEADPYFTALASKLQRDGTLTIMADSENIAALILKLEASGFYVKRFARLLYGQESDVDTCNVLLFANLNDAPIKCKYWQRIPDVFYVSSVATTESYLVANLTDENAIVFDPFCTNAHTLDGTLHEGRKFIGFCQGAIQFDQLKFYTDNFKADQDVFKRNSD